jgi:hypothetical protein
VRFLEIWSKREVVKVSQEYLTVKNATNNRVTPLVLSSRSKSFEGEVQLHIFYIFTKREKDRG